MANGMTMSKSIFGLSFFRIYADIDEGPFIKVTTHLKNLPKILENPSNHQPWLKSKDLVLIYSIFDIDYQYIIIIFCYCYNTIYIFNWAGYLT